MGLADVGMAQASTRFGGERLASRDSEGEVTAIWTAAAITLSVTALAAAAGAVAARPILSGLLNVHGTLLEPGILAFRIICVALVAQAFSGTLNTPQVIRVRWGSYTLVTTGSSVIQVAMLPVALVLFTSTVVVAALVSLLAGLVGAVGTLLVAARIQPAILRPRVTRKMAKPLLRYGSALSVAGIAAIPLSTAERLLLAHYRSVTVVAYYVVASRLATLLAVIPGAVSGPLFPAIVRLTDSGRIESARSLYRQALQGAFLVLTPAVLLLAFLARPFLGLWGGAQYAQHSTIPFYVLLFGGWCNSLAYIPYSYMLASSRTRTIARIHLAEILPYVMAGAILTSRYGALGAAIVWTARVTLDSVVFFWSATGSERMPFALLPSRWVSASISTLALAGILVLLSAALPSLAARAGCAVGLSLLYGTLLWFVVLTTRERAGLARLRDSFARPFTRLRRNQS